MNQVELYKKLISAARFHGPGGQVPYAFEKRVTARLASRVVSDNLSLWVHGLWRAAVSCVAITLLLGAWAVLNPATTATTSADLSQNFVSTLLASVDQGEPIQ